LINNYRTF